VLFESVRPVAAGYFQSDLALRRPPRDPARQAVLLYVSSGEGVWTVGPWTFPVKRGDLLAIPPGMEAKAALKPPAPLAYFYAYFEPLPEAGAAHLDWPWDLGLDLSTQAAGPLPRASGTFRAEIATLFRQLQDELRRRGPAARLAARSHLSLLGVTFVRMLVAHKAVPEGERSGRRAMHASGRLARPLPEAIAKAVDYVHAHLDRELSLGELARVAHYSERRFVQIFRRAVGLSPMAFVRNRRVREAQKLLARHTLSVKEIAGRLNFADAQHFSRVFRQVTGVSPTQYAAGAPSRQPRASGYFAVSPEEAVRPRRSSRYGRSADRPSRYLPSANSGP